MPIGTDLAGAVDEVLTRAALKDHFSGVVRLVRGDELVHEGAYGVALRRWEVPMRAGMRFDLASVTKLFTAVLRHAPRSAGRRRGVGAGARRRAGCQLAAEHLQLPPIGSPDGGAHATAADLVRFLDAVRGGELLGAERTDLFLTPQVVHHEEDGYTFTYRFGLVFEVLPDGRLRDFYKEGINIGASAIVEHYPAQDVTLALVANSENGIWGPLKQIDKLVYG